MGLFSSKKKTYVSSQTFNMGGSFKERAPFLKTVVIGAVVRDEINPMFSIGNAITSSYLNGPGIKLRNYGSWLERVDYWATLGQGRSYIGKTLNIDQDKILPHIPNVGPDDKVSILDLRIGVPTADDAVDRFMLNNFPEFSEYINYSEEQLEEIDFDYYTVSDEEAGITVPAGKIIIVYKGNIYTIDSIASDKLSLIITYNQYREEDYVLEFKDTVLDPPVTFPLYVETKNTIAKEDPVVKDDIYKVIEYKDGSIEEILVDESYVRLVVTTGEFHYKVSDDYLYEYEYHEYIKEDIEIEELPLPEPEEGEEVVEKGDSEIIKSITLRKTIRTLVTEDNIYREIIKRANVIDIGSYLMIYEEGSGNPELDKVFNNNDAGASPYYPVMPIRLGSRNVGPGHWEGLYNLNKQGYRKMTNQSYDKMIRQMNDSPGIGDINTGFMQIGTAMNSPDPSAQEYIFKHFRHYTELEKQVPNRATYIDRAWYNINQTVEKLKAQIAHKKKREDDYWSSVRSLSRRWTPPPIENTPPPPPPSYTPAINRGIYNANLGRMGYHISFTWDGLHLNSGSGRYKDLKTGGYLLENSNKNYPTYARIENILESADDQYVSVYTKSVNVYTITAQITDNYWEQILVFNPYHDNSIKNGKGIGTRPFDYNEGSDESACVLPMNREIMRKMSLKNATQMSIGAKYLTFTAFKVVKKKWYQSGIFKIIMVVVTIAVSIYFAPAGAAGGGLLGANATIGAALGLGGTAAIVAGAITNAVAGMVVSSIISKAANKLFGAKFGAILGAIANFVVANVATSMGQGMSMQEAFVGLMKADNIMSLGNAIGKGYLGAKQASTLDILKQSQEMLDGINKQLSEVNDKMESQFKNSAIIDPLYLTDVFGGFFKESSSDFVSRTLMTGSDVAEITFNLIYNFANINLESKLE